MGLLQKDYLVDQFIRFADAIRMCLEKSRGGEDDGSSAIQLLETQIGEAVNIDGSALLSLAPDSVSSILQVSDTDPGLAEYIVRSLMLEASMLDDANDSSLAGLRREQASVVARDYGLDIPDDAVSPEEFEAFFEESLAQARDEKEGDWV